MTHLRAARHNRAARGVHATRAASRARAGAAPGSAWRRLYTCKYCVAQAAGGVRARTCAMACPAACVREIPSLRRAMVREARSKRTRDRPLAHQTAEDGLPAAAEKHRRLAQRCSAGRRFSLSTRVPAARAGYSMLLGRKVQYTIILYCTADRNTAEDSRNAERS